MKKQKIKQLIISLAIFTTCLSTTCFIAKAETLDKQVNMKNNIVDIHKDKNKNKSFIKGQASEKNSIKEGLENKESIDKKDKTNVKIDEKDNLKDSEKRNEENNKKQETQKNKWIKEGNKIYYKNNKEEKVKGWNFIDNKWYFFDETGSMEIGWKLLNGQWYYLNEDGSVATGFKVINGKKYYLNDSGIMLTGWKLINNKWYYLNGDGSVATGWKSLNGQWYYLNEDGSMATGLKVINGKEYYLNDNGSMATGWKLINNKWYYLNNNGSIVTGWKSLNGKWYFLNSDGSMATGWKSLNGQWYFLNSDGSMAIGWKNSGDTWYYLNNSGIMAKGWALVNGRWYYLNTNGSMIRNCTKKIGGIDYRFYPSGSMYSNVWLNDSTYVNLNGVTMNNVTPSISHSKFQYNLFKYMTNEQNEQSVDTGSIRLHGGITSNNCVFFTSEALRRVGLDIPRSTGYTSVLEGDLLRRGFRKSYDLRRLKPGDIVFCREVHVYTFMGWIDDEYGFIVDNQQSSFGSVLHKRRITKYDPEWDTNGATHFYYLPV